MMRIEEKIVQVTPSDYVEMEWPADDNIQLMITSSTAVSEDCGSSSSGLDWYQLQKILPIVAVRSAGNF